MTKKGPLSCTTLIVCVCVRMCVCVCACMCACSLKRLHHSCQIPVLCSVKHHRHRCFELTSDAKTSVTHFLFAQI